MVLLPKVAAEGDLTPEEAREMYERALRVQQEREDAAYEERQKRKLEREIKNPKKRRDTMLEPGSSKGHSAEQEKLLEEYLSGKSPAPTPKPKSQPQSEPSSAPDESEYFQPEPPGGWKCMVPGHEDRPAVMKLKHHGMLDENMGDLTFCEDCAYKFKMIPLTSKMEKWIGGSNMDVLKKIAELANKCDKQGLYEEASMLDELINKYSSSIE